MTARRFIFRALLPAVLGAGVFFAVLSRPPVRADDSEAVPPNIERSVDHGLAWLAQNQGGDGSWSGGGGGGSVAAAATGLSAMAFMARGHVPGQGPYGEVLNRAIDAIDSMQQADGLIDQHDLGRAMYDHGICTVALCEAYGMLDDARQEKTRTVISRAVRLILNAQRIPKNTSDQGGWRYTPDTNSSDTSVTGWQLMALRGAKNIGAYLPQDAINDGIGYIKRRAVLGGGFDYQGGGGANPALTGTGVLALSLMGQPDAPEVAAGGDYLLRNSPLTNGHYFYSVYYCSQAGWQLGGRYWTTLNNEISTDLLKKQSSSSGAWTGGEGGDVVSTSMAILALTVPYRYLPIYQR